MPPSCRNDLRLFDLFICAVISDLPFFLLHNMDLTYQYEPIGTTYCKGQMKSCLLYPEQELC